VAAEHYRRLELARNPELEELLMAECQLPNKALGRQRELLWIFARVSLRTAFLIFSILLEASSFRSENIMRYGIISGSYSLLWKYP
jgi:hypothetical protein